MTLDKTDEGKIKKIVVSVVGNALEQMVLPQFEKIFKKLEEHDKKFEEIDGRFQGIEERLDDVDNTMNRMETKLDATIKVTDKHSTRLALLEKHI